MHIAGEGGDIRCQLLYLGQQLIERLFLSGLPHAHVAQLFLLVGPLSDPSAEQVNGGFQLGINKPDDAASSCPFLTN